MSPLNDFVALSLLSPWWWREAAERLRAHEPPADVLATLAGRRDADAGSDGGSGNGSGNGSAAMLSARASLAVERGRSHQLAPLAWDDGQYPVALASITDPPFVLWTRGQVSALHRPAVAIVGARAASPYGTAVAEQLAADLVAHGVVIVSGLARGVDSAAHRGALSGGGSTVAVLGCGADIIYPSEHAALATEIEAAGAVISELAPGTRPLPHFFPLRNRIISGLSRAVVVIEAGEKSGSLITARCALEQGREVLAVPGNVLSGRYRGGHALLRDGAKIVESADDILEELGVASRPAVPGKAAPPDPILDCLTPGEPSDLDQIAAQTGLNSARLLARLFDLELTGRVKRTGGGRFVRVDSPC